MKKTLVLTLLLIAAIFCKGQNNVVGQREIYDKIVEAGIAHPLIVLKQGIHESANFKSNAAIKRNNIFGFKSGKMVFDSIDACIDFYKRWQDKRYKGGKYFAFLRRIGYAADKSYERKVTNIKIDFVIE